ncbi:MAG: hypothetical protein IJ876_00495 [Elusimicrobiaceae bacterium]|nr:hypothetical protein [Elusimicrobiaceae bacterium]
MTNRGKLTWNKIDILLVALVCLAVPAQAQKGKNIIKAAESAVTRKLPGVKPPKLPKTSVVPTVKVPHVSTVPVVHTVPTVDPHLPPTVSAVPAAALVTPVQSSQAIPQFHYIDRRDLHSIIGLEEAIEEFATTHNRIKNSQSLRHDLVNIKLTFYEADNRWFGFDEDNDVSNVSADVLWKSYQEIWLASSKEAKGIGRSLRQYTEPDSPLQPIFKLREQQLQYLLTPSAEAPRDQRFVLLDETSMRVVQEIKFWVANLNAYDPLRADIQRILGTVENNVTGESSRSFLDISKQLPDFMEEFDQFGLSKGRDELRIRDAWDAAERGFKKADNHIFVKRGNKVYVRPDVRKGVSYEETWKDWVNGRSVRGYVSAESPLQQAFELRQKQLDFLLENRESFLVDPTVGNTATVLVAQEIHGLILNLEKTNLLRKYFEAIGTIDWSKYMEIGQ